MKSQLIALFIMSLAVSSASANTGTPRMRYNPSTNHFDYVYPDQNTNTFSTRTLRPFEVISVPDEVVRSPGGSGGISTSSTTSAPANPRRHGALNCQNPQGDFNCMACNCFNEAAPRYDDQVSVGKVVMTRVQMPQFPNTVCGVIKQRLQFSWFNTPRTRRTVPANHACFSAAEESLRFRGYFADHYHANYVRPRWARNMRRVTQIGVHIYYSYYRPPRGMPSGGTDVSI